MDQDSKLVLLEKINNIGIISFNNPNKLNILSRQLVQDLSDILKICEKDNEIHICILQGNGKGFCAGGNLEEFYNQDKNDNKDYVAHWECVFNFKKPIIASIAGFAIGGGLEIALMCDYIIASDESYFSQPELKLGFIPGCGASARLFQRMGYAKTLDFILSAKKITALKALELNIIDEVCAVEFLREHSINKANEWIKYIGKDAINFKHLMRQRLDGSIKQGQHIKQERDLFYQMMRSDKSKDLIKNFLQKKVR